MNLHTQHDHHDHGEPSDDIGDRAAGGVTDHRAQRPARLAAVAGAELAPADTEVDVEAEVAVLAKANADLLHEIVSTTLGPLSRRSESTDLTLEQLSEWIARPESRRHIFNLLGLLDAQTQLLIAQHRVMAAVQLARLAQDETAGPETVRRACKDLLNVRLVARSRPRDRDPRGGDDLAPLPLPPPRRPIAPDAWIDQEYLRRLLGGGRRRAERNKPSERGGAEAAGGAAGEVGCSVSPR